MTWRAQLNLPDHVPPGVWLASLYPGLGATGAQILAASGAGEHGPGPLVNDSLDLSAEYWWWVVTPPVGATVVLTAEGQALLTAAADGSYPWTYKLKENGVLVAGPNPDGSTTVTTLVGVAASVLAGNAALANATASGALSGGASSQLAGAAQLGSTAASGTLGAGTASALAGAAQLADAEASGSLAQAGLSVLQGATQLADAVASGALSSVVSVLTGSAQLVGAAANGALASVASVLTGNAQLARTSASGGMSSGLPNPPFTSRKVQATARRTVRAWT